MYKRALILFVLITCLFTTFTQEKLLKKEIYLEGGELYYRSGSGERVKVDEGREKLNLTIEPGGEKAVYNSTISLDSQGKVHGELYLVDMKRGKSKTIPLEGKLLLSSLSRFEWIKGNLLGIEGHVNPSMAIYYVLNIKTLEIIASYEGHSFLWSPDRRSLCYIKSSPHFTPEEFKLDSLMLEEKQIFPPADKQQAQSLLLDSRQIVWSPDGRYLAFVSYKGDGNDDSYRLHVLKLNSGESYTFRLAKGDRYSWIDRGELTVTGRGGRFKRYIRL